MKTILVPTDFSECASQALEYALKLSDKMLAEVHVIHVLDQSGYDHFDTYGAGQALDDVFTKKLLEKVKEELNQLEKKYESRGITTVFKMATSIRNEVVEYGESINADLIVMGSKGTSGLEESLIGSNAERMVRTSTCPVLILKNEASSNIENIVFASDFEELSAKAMDKLKYYQELFGAKLHLLRVCTPNSFENTEKLEQEIHEAAKKFDLDNYKVEIFNDFYPEDGIANFTSFHDYDLICMTTSGKTGLSHFFSQSLAEDVVNKAEKPVLTFNLKTMN